MAAEKLYGRLYDIYGVSTNTHFTQEVAKTARQMRDKASIGENEVPGNQLKLLGKTVSEYDKIYQTIFETGNPQIIPSYKIQRLLHIQLDHSYSKDNSDN
jgi:hypothetical protein